MVQILGATSKFSIASLNLFWPPRSVQIVFQFQFTQILTIKSLGNFDHERSPLTTEISILKFLTLPLKGAAPQRQGAYPIFS